MNIRNLMRATYTLGPAGAHETIAAAKPGTIFTFGNDKFRYLKLKNGLGSTCVIMCISDDPIICSFGHKYCRQQYFNGSELYSVLKSRLCSVFGEDLVENKVEWMPLICVSADATALALDNAGDAIQQDIPIGIMDTANRGTRWFVYSRKDVPNAVSVLNLYALSMQNSCEAAWYPVFSFKNPYAYVLDPYGPTLSRPDAGSILSALL